MFNSSEKPVEQGKYGNLSPNSFHNLKYNSTVSHKQLPNNSQHNPSIKSFDTSQQKRLITNSASKLPYRPQLPNRHINHNQNNSSHKNGVTYGQLQIILENIQKIKNKANDQIIYLEKVCKNQDKKIKELEKKLDKYQNIEKTIQSERQLFKQENNKQIINLETIICQNRQRIISLERQIQEQSRNYGMNEKNINELQSKLKQMTKEKLQLERKYTNLKENFGIINDNEAQQFHQKYKNLNVLLEKFSALESKQSDQAAYVQLLQNNIEQLQGRIEDSNIQSASLASQNKQLQQEIKLFDTKIKDLEKQIGQLNTAKKKLQINITQTNEYHAQNMKALQEKIQKQQKQHQTIIAEYLQKISSLQDYISEQQHRKQYQNQQQKFKQIVDQVCDDNEDNQNIVKRLMYLEKFRSEYYLMVNKVQFICRMLDE